MAKETPAPASENDPPKCPPWDILKSQILVDPQALIQHAEDLSTPKKPLVPEEKRHWPNTPADNLAVLSRAGSIILPGNAAQEEAG